jgi:stress response protein YsnF
MSTSIIGLFESQDVARKAAGALTDAGCNEDAVEILSGSDIDRIINRLVEAGHDKDKARRYGEALQDGGALIVAEAEDDRADEALNTLRRYDVLTLQGLQERNRANRPEETAKAQVIEEELEVGKAQMTGGKRLKTSVSEREVQETITLREESVEVDRNRIDRVLPPEEAAKAFQERTIEMAETREKPVVSKQAHVVEEVVLSKHAGEREVTVSGTVRRQDVTVEDIDRKSGGSRRE